MRDLYPSRTPEITSPRFMDRLDPVIYGEPERLTRFELNYYETNGYLVIPRFFNHRQLNGLIEASNSLFGNPPDSAIREPNSKTVRSVFRVHEEQPFRDAGLMLREAAQCIIGKGMYVHQSRINYKARFSATGWAWHSDFETWHTEDGMPRMRCVSAMVALTDNVESNGPLMIIPGSHKRFLGCVGSTPEGNYAQHLSDQKVGVPDEASLEEFLRESRGRISSLTCEAGTVVLFDCNAMHGSNSNITNKWRTNLFFVFNHMENRLVAPYCGRSPRPEYVATRQLIKEFC